MTLTKQFITDTKKAYKNIAKLRIEGNNLVIRNIANHQLHPFKDGRMSIPVSGSQIVEINEWL